MLPPGADAAVMVEHTEEAGEGAIEVLKPVGPGKNVREQMRISRQEMRFSGKSSASVHRISFTWQL